MGRNGRRSQYQKMLKKEKVKKSEITERERGLRKEEKGTDEDEETE